MHTHRDKCIIIISKYAHTGSSLFYYTEQVCTHTQGSVYANNKQVLVHRDQGIPMVSQQAHTGISVL